MAQGKCFHSMTKKFLVCSKTEGVDMNGYVLLLGVKWKSYALRSNYKNNWFSWWIYLESTNTHCYNRNLITIAKPLYCFEKLNKRMKELNDIGNGCNKYWRVSDFSRWIPCDISSFKFSLIWAGLCESISSILFVNASAISHHRSNLTAIHFHFVSSEYYVDLAHIVFENQELI